MWRSAHRGELIANPSHRLGPEVFTSGPDGGSMTRPTYDPTQASELLRRLGPNLETLFRGFEIQAAEADQMVGESLVVLGVRRAHIHDPDSWFLDVIQSRCDRLVEKRGETRH